MKRIFACCINTVGRLFQRFMPTGMKRETNALAPLPVNRADGMRRKLADLCISESDVAKAVAWSRKSR